MLMRVLVDNKWLLCGRTILPWLAVLGKRVPITDIARMMAIKRCRDLQWARKLYDLSVGSVTNCVIRGIR